MVCADKIIIYFLKFNMGDVLIGGNSTGAQLSIFFHAHYTFI